MIKSSKKWIAGILAFLFCLNVLAWIVLYGLWQIQFLEVVFFDVGQGDAIFIETPQKHQVLIDGGPDSTIIDKLAKEMPFWDRTIDLIILTHPEHDHLAGLLEVLKRYNVENILWTGVVRDTSEFQIWQELIKKEKAEIRIAKAGQKIIFQRSGCNPDNLQESSPCIFLDILYPFENLEGKEIKDSNNTSIIGRLAFGDNSFLLTGDAYKSVERKIIENNHNLNTDVLKIAHHGSKTSTAKDFIEKLSPKIAVIQSGKNNPYGHPHRETLEILEKYGIKTFRTDEDGDIKILSDGVNLTIK